MYGTGSTESGRLGMFDEGVDSTKVKQKPLRGPVMVWTPIQFPDRDIEFTSFACGGQHSLAATARNEVYTWGYGLFGQLGHGIINKSTEHVEMEPRPRKMARVTREIATDEQPELKEVTIHHVDAGPDYSAIVFSKK